jgi:hypothetical protein
MAYSQSPPLVTKEWLTGEEITSGVHARDLHARSNQRIGIQPKKPSIHSPHSSGIKDDRAASSRPSISRRIFRTLTRFFIAVLIGVGATLAWQSYGDAAREMMVARVPTLAWLLPVSATKPLVVAATPPASAQQLESLASNLDDVRRGVEQLAAKEEQMAQNIVTLQAVEEDIRQKMLYTPPSPSQAAPIPQQKPAQPRAQSSAAQSSSVPRPSPPTGHSRSRADAPDCWGETDKRVSLLRHRLPRNRLVV